jgi:hypothetical protein
MERVIPFLLSVAKALEEQGEFKSHEVAGVSGKTEDARRKFESRDSGRAVDEWAAAFADTLGLTVFDFWRLVIDVAEAVTLSERESEQALLETKQASARRGDELMRMLSARSELSRTSD